MAYTNSPMVAYTKLSPNHSGQRTHSIDRISPHCVVGQCSVETLGNIFYPTSRQASCQYGIGSDGRVGMYVEEKNRSWCTSSNANDQRAITIECASDTTEPYTMNSKVYNTLIALCTDICKRYGKTKLIWIADKDKSLAYEPKSNEMVITVHRWFANKSCPGKWLYDRLGDVAEKVTAALGGSTSQPVVPAPTPAASNEETIWNFLKGKGLNAFAVAGVMGNLYAESGLRPNNLQNTYEKSLGFTDDSYTAAVDKGSYGNFVKDSAGYGLAQWTYWSRKQALLDYAKSVGKSIGDMGMQLDFLWKELQGYTSVMKVLNSATTVLEASNAILTGFERPADMGATVQAKRAGYGQTYYDKYAGGTVTPSKPAETVTSFPATPFTVQVIVSDLNYRSEGSMNGAIKGQTGKGVFTIVEVNKDGWGKLKSGVGWIYLGNPSYCTVQNTQKINYGQKVYDGAVKTYGTVCTVKCKHKSGAKTLAEIKSKKVTTCNTSSFVSGKEGGIFKGTTVTGHTAATGKNGSTLLKVKKTLSQCVKNSNALDTTRAKWVFAGCTYDKLPAGLKEPGNIYYYDSNSAVSAGGGKIFSTNNGGDQLNSEKRYYDMSKVTRTSGYCFTHTILWVAHPLTV